MNALLDHFQLTLLAGGALVWWLQKRLQESRQHRALEALREAEAYLDSAEESRAPGYSGGAAAPPLLPALPPRREPGYAAEAAREQAQALKHQQDAAAHLRLLLDTKATTTGGAAATRARLAAKDQAPSPPAAPLASLRKMLRDPAAIRRAAALREILDPPLSLR